MIYRERLKRLVIVVGSLMLPAAMPGAWGNLFTPAEKVEVIKLDAQYIYGEGRGETPEDADRKALDNLLSKIGINVESTFSMLEEETHDNGETDARSAVKSVLNTYSQATVNNTETIDLHDKDGGYYRMRFMKREELQKMFDRRRDRVEDYVRTALRSEEKGRIDDALRFLNWAYVLLHSLQYPSEVKMRLEGEDRLLVNWIPNRMSDILDNVDVRVADVLPDNTVDLMFTYKGEPAAGIDFTYWNGKVKSPVTSAKDGMGRLLFPSDYPIHEIAVTIETSFAESSRVDKELELMIGHFKPLAFPKSRKAMGVEEKALKADKAAKKEFQSQVAAGKKEGVTPLDKKHTKEYSSIMEEVLKSVKNKSYQPDGKLFTPEGLDMFRRLLCYGNATVVGDPDPGFYPFGERVVARSVPMSFTFVNSRRNFIEDVTFTFSPDKKIESVAFGLGATARKDIFEQGAGAWSDSVKMVIVTFLENYKTAFALKRLDYIRSIFDDNAYIIVGHKLRKLQGAPIDASGMSVVPQYEFVRKSKDEYLTQLEKCFASNEFVNINFTDNDVQKSAIGGDTFGIQIKQDYHSEHYGDQGYLFLFVDLNEADKPVIKIRTWQPERNPDLTPMLPKSNRDFGIYSTSSFQ